MKAYSNYRILRRSIMSLLLMLTMAVSLSAPAFATDENIQPAASVDDAKAVEDADKNQHAGLADSEKTAYFLLNNLQDSVIEQVPSEETSTDFPARFDLRDEGVVTPVKFQNPFGSCWGFSAIAACETSILSAMGKTYEETGLDLSEHQLAWFARTYLQDGSSQDGEGVHMYDETEALNTGGCPFTASSMFSSGIGPVTEELIPYRGRESMTDTELIWNYCYSDQDDWSIPSDYEFVQSYELIESNILPDTAVYSTDEDGNSVYVGFDASAAEMWKQELMAGRAISVAFCADDYYPDSESIMPLYLNTDDNAWAHYTFDDGEANHAVCIVGWDDTFPASKFLDHSNEEYGDGLAHQPEGDGAWIVKNSWGSELESFPNNSVWGLEDEDGNSTGYFYISYYDRSLCMAETFEFDVNEKGYEGFMIDQYDYLQAENTNGWVADTGMQMANVFTAESDSNINAVSCETNSSDVSVTYQVYLLDDTQLPDEGTLVATVQADYPFAGYHKEYLEQTVPVEEGQRYSVVVTSCFKADNTVYYELCSQIAENQECVDEHNRQIRYSNRNLPESEYEDSLSMYYSKGVVNPGESYVYIDKMGQWTDFSDVIPFLQEDEKFSDYDFDNFPVKAYLTYMDEATEAEGTREIMTSELVFAEPAEAISSSAVADLAVKGLLYIAGAALAVFIVVKIVRDEKELKKFRAEVRNLKSGQEDKK